MSVHSPRPLRYKQPDPRYMTFVEHLDELRHRLIVIIVAIGAGSVAGWFLAPRVIRLIDEPLRHYLHQQQMIVPTIYGGFTLQLKIAVIIGFAFALPVTVYELWAFLAPAFGPAANRWAPIWITTAILLFCAGAIVGYEVIPLAVRFFSGYQSREVQILVFASEYVGFIGLILLVFGISFELPLALVSLSALGITSSAWLASKRLVAFFGCFIFATVVTPGADVFSPLILGSILYVLYEVSIIVSKLIGK